MLTKIGNEQWDFVDADGEQIALPPADMAKYYREVREIERMLGRNRLGEEGEGSGNSESFKDANWQLRHFREPTENW